MTEALLYIILATLITLAAYCLKPLSVFLNILSAAALTFLALYWVASFPGITGFAFTIILGATGIYSGYRALYGILH